ncbi:MAG: sugar transferase, partial [Coprococcus sp.]
MYKRSTSGWLKHFDFIILDMLCLQVSFLLSYIVRHGLHNPYAVPIYRNMAIFIELADICIMFFFSTLKNVLKRGYYKEFTITVKHMGLLELLSVLYLFSVQGGDSYSRIALYLMGIIYAFLTYCVRTLWKLLLRDRMETGGKRNLLIVTKSVEAHELLDEVRNNNYEMFNITGIAITDR